MKSAAIVSPAPAPALCSAGPSQAEGDLPSGGSRIRTDESGGAPGGMADCIHQENVLQDMLLSANHEKAMDAAGRIHGKTGQRGLKDAETAWLRWRDPGLPLFQYAGGGTFPQLRAAEDFLEKTARRARFLGELAEMIR